MIHVRVGVCLSWLRHIDLDGEQFTLDESDRVTVVQFSTVIDLMGRAMPSSVEQAQVSMVVESWISRQAIAGGVRREAVSVVHGVPDDLFNYLADMLVMG